MVRAVGLVGLLVIVLVNSALAALMTRFFRVRLKTVWGTFLFVLFLIPLTMAGVLFVLSGVVGLGGNLGNQATAITVTMVVPLALGITFDYFWMPAPDDVDVPERPS